MSEYISRESIVTLLEQYGYIDKEMERDLASIPSADVRENIHARWLKVKKGITAGEFSHLFKCSCCNYELYDDEFNFCPTCGADMREPKREKGTE